MLAAFKAVGSSQIIARSLTMCSIDLTHGCSLQNFASREFDSPPNIDNYHNHPFMHQADAAQAASSSNVGSQMPDKAAKAEASSSSLAAIGQRATSPVPAAANKPAARRPTPPPTATAQMMPAAPQMMDLLSLEEPASSPAAAPSQPAADGSDGRLLPLCCDSHMSCLATAGTGATITSV